MLRIVLIAMSVAALIIGAFLIANTFGIVITQRTRELAVLRAAGATGGQVLGSVLLEALIVGVVASAVGVVVGVLGTLGLRSLSRAFGVAIPEGDLDIQPLAILAALILGVGVTVLAALGPARRAAATSPIASMRASAGEPERVPVRRRILGILVLGAGVVIAGLPSQGMPMPCLGLGIGLALVGVVTLAPVALRPLISLLGLIGSTSVAGQVARESALREPRRTAATVMALAFGLALMVFAAVVGASVKAATAEQYREVIAADVVVESAGQEMLGGVHAAVFDEVAAVDGVGTATRIKYGHWRDRGVTSALSAIEPDRITEVAHLRMIDGELALLDAGGVVIAERVAAERGLGIGDALPMTFARTGEVGLPIVGIIADGSAQALQTDYLVSLATYAQHFTEDMDASIFVTAADGVSPEQLAAALAVALEDHPTVQVRDHAAVVAGRTQTVDQLFGLVTVLLAFAMVIAVLGIANTLSLSIVERTREIGLLRAVGMSRASAWLMVEIEAVLVSATAVVVGVLLGLGAAVATIAALATTAPLELVVPWDQGLVLLAVSAVGLVAGVLPARRAARLPVLEAIAERTA